MVYGNPTETRGGLHMPGLMSLSRTFLNLFTRLLQISRVFLSNLYSTYGDCDAMVNKIQDTVIATILDAVLEDRVQLSILSRIVVFFTLIRVPLQRFHPELFKKLRQEAWAIDEQSYRQCFQVKDGEGRSNLQALSELGYSGSVCTFLRASECV